MDGIRHLAVETNIGDAIKVARGAEPSRELSLVITKLEEAQLWLSKVTINNGD